MTFGSLYTPRIKILADVREQKNGQNFFQRKNDLNKLKIDVIPLSILASHDIIKTYLHFDLNLLNLPRAHEGRDLR